MKKHFFISIFLALALCVGSLSSALAQTDVTEGGTATSSGGIRTGEEPAKAFDNTTSTKWCVTNVDLPVYIRYDFAGTTTYAVNSYTVASADDSPERDPKNWQLQGSNDGTNWTTLDTRSNIAFTSRFQTQTFTFSNSTSYQMYQLNISAYYSGTDGKVQLSELQMFASGVGSAPAAPTGLTATAGDTQIALSWTASSGATSYSVYRGTTAGDESTTAIASGITTMSYTNTGLTNGTAYYYKVTANNVIGTSGYSNEASATPTAAAIDPSSWTMTFNDDFNSLDVSENGTTTWKSQLPYSGQFGCPVTQSYLTVSGGILTIKASFTGSDKCDSWGSWTGGLMCTLNSSDQGFAQQYGYFEVSAKMPTGGEGIWAAPLWLMGNNSRAGFEDGTSYAEIDVNEYYGNQPGYYYYSLHQWNPHVGTTEPVNVCGGQSCLSDSYHTYGVLITPDVITYYCDRNRVYSATTTDVCKVPIYPLLNLVVGSGYSTCNLPNNIYMYVDYMRVWALPNGMKNATDDDLLQPKGGY